MNYKALVESLSNPDITKRDYDAAIEAINTRVNNVWRYIIEKSNRTISWWAFGNIESLGRGNGSTGGFFDPRTDSEVIELDGEFSPFYTDDFDDDNSHQYGRNPFYQYHEGFPTELLWAENWKEIVDAHITDAVEKHKTAQAEKRAKKQANKIKKIADAKQLATRQKELKESIKNKVRVALTDEEYNYLMILLEAK